MPLVRIDDTIRRIRAYRHLAGLSEGQLAGRAGLDGNALRGMDKQSWNPTAATLRKLELTIPADFDPSKGGKS